MRRSFLLISFLTFNISIHAPIVGCDPEGNNTKVPVGIFQSTHPSWGATLAVKGCPTAFHSYFNPRTHRGVRHSGFFNAIMVDNISIHAPIVGCDAGIELPDPSKPISIHAPIVGCDGGRQGKAKHNDNFNPRTHRGVRRHIQHLLNTICRFQSTHPSWGATTMRSDYG